MAIDGRYPSWLFVCWNLPRKPCRVPCWRFPCVSLSPIPNIFDLNFSETGRVDTDCAGSFAPNIFDRWRSGLFDGCWGGASSNIVDLFLSEYIFDFRTGCSRSVPYILLVTLCVGLIN